MKKSVSLILALICGFGLLGCNKGVETMYVEGIVVNGIFYDISHQPMPAEVDDSAIIGYIESYTDTVPKKDGETNISKDLIGAPYAEVEDGIALLYKNEWYLCSPVEEAIGAPLAPEETDIDLESVSYIEVMSGLAGGKITVNDAGSVQRVMDDIESLRYKKKGAVEEVEYAYRIRFYNENYDELERIFITEENGHQISYDGYYYLVEADQNINIDYLEELLKDAPPAEQGDEGNDELWDLIPMVMVNGELYLDTGYKAVSVKKCGTMDGKITSEVAGSKQPTEDNQSNFGIGYGYQYGTREGTIEIYMNNQWFIFATEDVRNQIPFFADEEETILFHDKVFHKSDLSEETIEWLENYNSLSEEEQLAISSIPAELYELCGYPTAEAMEATDE